MSVTPFRAPQGSLLATVSLYRMPDGEIRAALDDMPKHVIEDRQTIANRFSAAAEWMLGGAQDFLRQACQFDEESQEGRA